MTDLAAIALMFISGALFGAATMLLLVLRARERE